MPFVLQPENYQHYVKQFEADERAATGRVYDGEPAPGAAISEAAWPWMEREIPWFDSSDKAVEEMYYFRWYAWKKHLVQTPQGYVITEWLPKPESKDAGYGALPDAAPFHLGEARWLHTRAIAEDDARFWFRPENDALKYSDALATAVREVTLANGDTELATSLLAEMKRVYAEWERTQQDANGLFWSIDTRDAMEKSISGDGYRPTLNSYMESDARAIAATAQLTHDETVAHEFKAKADRLHRLIETVLWNPTDKFYEVVSPAKDSSIHSQKKFKDPGTAMQFSGARELIGYLPWQYSEPAPGHGIAWKQLFDPQGFDGRYGATTAERRNPRFRFPSSDQCTWNGPAWPFAMTQTLNTLAAYLDGAGSHVLQRSDYMRLFDRYVLAQHLTLKDKRTIDWIDEDYDADTDEWIAKRMLIEKHKQVGRGNYYNHSGFADPLICGAIGLRPQAGGHVVIEPLVRAWSYFAIDALPYHGHMLTIVWDATGSRYKHGKGMWLAEDGHILSRRPTLGRLEAQLK
ncbi:MGH1-like glycoside hydrolase domain-containing protein [Silvibacterium sp.]|uniref:MGH1-like glycoside hydrolase domain-containing protein n=1 Tax=Silvibacterium sp. TaxID=1964179 RepID=UPI0039E315E5